MPELPEVEVVRRGLAEHVLGRSIVEVEVRHPRAVRSTEGGAGELVARVCDREVESVQRRGKFLWLVLDSSEALLVHLGMSGQMLVKTQKVAAESDMRHVRIRAGLSDAKELWFVDQRTFGYWRPTELVTSSGRDVPAPMAHIASDLLEPSLDLSGLASALGRRSSEIKKLLLDQTVVSGIGNIYADEMLWAARINPTARADQIPSARLEELLLAGQIVMREALEQGGTSFDALYVNVNGQSGYFDLHLNAYGQDGKACRRCGAAIVKTKFTNRSSHFCPQCQAL